MSIDTKPDRETLKSYFKKNAIPTEANFEALINGMINQQDDGIAREPGQPLSLQADVNDTSVKKVINFYENFTLDENPVWTLSLNPRMDPADAKTAKAGWSVGDADGNSKLFIDKSSGNIGIGTTNPTSSLEIGGYNTNHDNHITIKTAGGNRFSGGIKFRVYNDQLGFTIENDERHVSNGLNILRHASGVPAEGMSTLFIRKEDGNVGIGTTAPAGKLDVTTGGVGTWNRFVVNTTNQWGDGDIQYVTIGAGGAAGIMLNNPHVVWHDTYKRASIRMGRSDGVKTGHWWDIGVRANNKFSILDGQTGVTGLSIEPNGTVDIRGFLLRKIHVVSGIGPGSGVDNGLIAGRVLNFTKLHAGTAIRVLYCDNLRVNGANASARWEIIIDGKSVNIFQDKYGNAGNYHAPATILGYAFKVGAGSHKIEIKVTAPVPGTPHSRDAYTGWNNSVWTIEAQEVWV